MRKYGRYTRRKFLRDSALFSAGLAGVSLAGCETTTTAPTATTAATTVATTQTPKAGGTMRVARNACCKDFDTRTGDARHGPQIWGLVCQKLLIMDPDFEYENVLCEDWSFNSAFDALNFTLRDGVKFHDDTDFTSQDVKDQLEIMNGTQPGPTGLRYTTQFSYVDSVDVDGDLELTINLTEPANFFVENMSTYNPAYIVPSEYMTNTESFAQLVGTGPYTLDLNLYESGVTYTVNKWDDYWADKQGISGYWKGPVYLDSLFSQTVPEEATSESMLLAGDVDLCEYVTQELYLNALAAHGDDYTFLNTPSVMYWHLVPNVRNPPFDELDFRRAFAQAIDWDEYVDVVYTGLDRFVDIFEGSPNAYSGGESALLDLLPSYDPDAAEATIQTYIDDGKLPLGDEINMLCDSTGKVAPAIPYLITEFSKVGLTINPIDKSGGDNKAFRVGNAYMPDDPASDPQGWWDFNPGISEFKGAVSNWSAVFNPFYSEAGFTMVPEGQEPLPGGGRENFGGVRDDTLDALILATKTMSGSALHDALDDIQAHIMANAYHIPIVGEMQLWAMVHELKGLDQFCMSWRCHEFSLSNVWLDR